LFSQQFEIGLESISKRYQDQIKQEFPIKLSFSNEQFEPSR